jgi:hypothetical protein
MVSINAALIESEDEVIIQSSGRNGLFSVHGLTVVPL